MDRKAVLKLLEELKAEMKESLGDKLVGLLLFGSYSRGDYSASSDVDLVILAEGVLSRAERDLIDDLIAERSLRHDVVISAIVYPSKTFQEYSTPFLLSVKEDGIAI
ncbi:nucleotidyltransferase domain-containing protein [Methanothrix harundinacea]|uniref:Putative nucleotidyltransferase n=1 Tax=Methanothrix harundinacea (strain 6Ac) TaxID=1110509 RepID=G7WN94_METH6|nr:nucleotidyltransferase domain-containing protein [Methanothrix harundinacea]AET64585.1 putative nucleotidyltransferase [Methanothrix harundinacea 6Ac]